MYTGKKKVENLSISFPLLVKRIVSQKFKNILAV